MQRVKLVKSISSNNRTIMLRFVINLDSSKDRLAVVSKRLQELGVPFERMPAVNGRALSDEEIAQITYPYNHFESRVRFTRELTKGEVGCFLSHRKCWERLLESDKQWAMIMEDDIQISNLAPNYMLSTEWIPPDVHICQLSVCSSHPVTGTIRDEVLKVDDDVTLVVPLNPPPVGCMCYLISRKAAELAVKLSEKLPAPVDDFLFTLWFEIANKFTVWRTSPTLVIPTIGVESDIGSRAKKDVHKAPFFIRHGIKRFLLDRQIKRALQDGKKFTFLFK